MWTLSATLMRYRSETAHLCRSCLSTSYITYNGLSLFFASAPEFSNLQAASLWSSPESHHCLACSCSAGIRSLSTWTSIPFAEDQKKISADPWDANQAIPTLMFAPSGVLGQRFAAVPSFRVAESRWLSLVAYPLTGGYRRWQLIPGSAVSPLLKLESLMLDVLGPLMAFPALCCTRALGRKMKGPFLLTVNCTSACGMRSTSRRFLNGQYGGPLDRWNQSCEGLLHPQL